MHLPPALLSSLRVALGGTALLGAACDQTAAAAPAEVIATTPAAQASAPARTSTTATVAPQPMAVTSLDDGATIEREPVLARGRLRARETTTALAFTGIEAAVTPDRTTTFVAADPDAPPKVRRKPKPVAATPVVREWSCGPCGRG